MKSRQNTAREYLYKEPAENVPELCLRKDAQAKLDADQRLEEHHREEEPALRAHPLTPNIGDVGVVLADGGGDDEAEQGDAVGVQRVAGRHLEDVLQEEGVQLGQLPADD